MISQVNSAAIRSAYNNNLGEPKEAKPSTNSANAKLTGTNKIEQLKESINAGEYKIDLTALSEKMAQELL
jgi:anti-sigma28 factor (negative regulator of flagellin synthesis)